MNELKMPKKGESARMLAQLRAEHAAAGPSEEAPQDGAVTPVTTLQRTPQVTGAPAQVEPSVTAQEPTPALTPAETESLDSPVGSEPAPAPDRGEPAAPRSRRRSERDERLALAIRRAADDEVAVVTVRVSAALNRYMDDYTARINRIDPKRKYRKQDAVLEAFAAFYADHPMPPAPETEEL